MGSALAEVGCVTGPSKQELLLPLAQGYIEITRCQKQIVLLH